MTKQLKLSAITAIGMLLLFVLPLYAGEFRFPLGFTYLSGSGEISSQMEDNLRAKGYYVDTIEGLPIGISFQPYYEFDFGLGIGVGLGPIIATIGDASLLDIPVNLSLRYAILPHLAITPYIRTGISSHIASGDYLESTNMGFVGAIGVEFMRNRAVSVGRDNQ